MVDPAIGVSRFPPSREREGRAGKHETDEPEPPNGREIFFKKNLLHRQVIYLYLSVHVLHVKIGHGYWCSRAKQPRCRWDKILETRHFNSVISGNRAARTVLDTGGDLGHPVADATIVCGNADIFLQVLGLDVNPSNYQHGTYLGIDFSTAICLYLHLRP